MRQRKEWRRGNWLSKKGKCPKCGTHNNFWLPLADGGVLVPGVTVNLLCAGCLKITPYVIKGDEDKCNGKTG